MSKRILVSTLIAAAVLGAGGAYAITANDRGQSAAGAEPIHMSYAFDPTDKAKMIDFAEEAFMGRVVGKVKTIEDDASTLWTVEVIDTVKGAKTGKVQVKQQAYVDSDGLLHESEDQPILQTGKEYLLLTTKLNDGNLLLLGGSTAAVSADTATKKNALKKEYQDAEKLDSGLKKPARSN